MTVQKQKWTKCECGQDMTAEDAEFWGECEACRLNLPLSQPTSERQWKSMNSLRPGTIPESSKEDFDEDYFSEETSAAQRDRKALAASKKTETGP